MKRLAIGIASARGKRIRDQDNYYITRCNALEDNSTIYRVVNDRRVAFLNQSVKVASIAVGEP